MSTKNGTTQQKIKVVLTGARPVMIDPELWPFIAVSDAKWWDNQYEFQANRTAKWDLDVRQHGKGCALVIGKYTYSTVFQGEADVQVECGLKLVAGADLIAAIGHVATLMEEAVAEEGRDQDALKFRRLARECIADLPAEEIDCCPEAENK